MVAQYFKRKREFVEIFIVSGSGLGIVVMSTFIKSAIEAIGWRFVMISYFESLLHHKTFLKQVGTSSCDDLCV